MRSEAETIDMTPDEIRAAFFQAHMLAPAQALAEINRRAEIEQYLLDCARGKHSLPDSEVCRRLALRLGTPKENWSEVLKEPLPLSKERQPSPEAADKLADTLQSLKRYAMDDYGRERLFGEASAEGGKG
ncbi:MAG TPA: hypothetical protein VFA75_07295 [Nevskia sp.]|nr:hypothetical protein [Nevskia sp.]